MDKSKKKKEKNESVGKVQGDCIVQFLKLRFKGVTTLRSLIIEESLNKQETTILAIKYGKSLKKTSNLSSPPSPYFNVPQFFVAR